MVQVYTCYFELIWAIMWVSFLFLTFREVLQEADKVTLLNHCSAVLFYIVALTYLYIVRTTMAKSRTTR